MGEKMGRKQCIMWDTLQAHISRISLSALLWLYTVRLYCYSNATSTTKLALQDASNEFEAKNTQEQPRPLRGQTLPLPRQLHPTLQLVWSVDGLL
jgi:hypothetical protein